LLETTSSHFKEIVMKTSTKTQSKLVNFMLAAGFLSLGCAAIGANALASDSPAAATAAYPVGYSDLDISTTKGAKTLYLRIRYAAETLCESAATWGKKEGEACVHKAVNDAVARVNAPLLSQYHQLRSKSDKAGPAQLAKAN
jgi:UrcA family protein